MIVIQKANLTLEITGLLAVFVVAQSPHLRVVGLNPMLTRGFWANLSNNAVKWNIFPKRDNRKTFEILQP